MDNAVAEKMRLLNRLADAIITAQQTFAVEPTGPNALAIQQLQHQREAIRRTLPKIREVA